MSVRFAKIWIWRLFVVTLVLCIIPTVVLISQAINVSGVQSYRHHMEQRPNEEESASTVSLHVPIYEKPANVILQRFPYRADALCQNFSISVYEDNTFDIVGLVSFPGSGNTWTRHLIHLATGVFTGSFYFDMDLFSKGFLGEREPWYSGRTIVQKFHEKYNRAMQVQKAILLIREPFPATLSLANYLEAGHTGNAVRLPYHHKDWPSFLLQSAYNWLSLAKSWIESPVQILVVHYEHLRLQPIENVRKMCLFLNHSCPYLTSPCFQRKLEGSFRRFKSLPLRTYKEESRLAKYPPEIKQLVSRGVDHLNQLLHLHGHESLPVNLYQHYVPLAIRIA